MRGVLCNQLTTLVLWCGIGLIAKIRTLENAEISMSCFSPTAGNNRRDESLPR